MDKIILAPLDLEFLETIKDYKKIHLKAEEGTYYTIILGDKKVGVIGFKIEEDRKIGLKIGIHQDYRGQGIFGRTLDCLASKHHLKKIYSEVAIANIRSVKAHLKIGFRRIPKKQEDLLKEKGLVYKRNMILIKTF